MGLLDYQQYLDRALFCIVLFCIGPKPKTIADFWSMVWQEEVSNIVCLTNLKEGTKV